MICVPYAHDSEGDDADNAIQLQYDMDGSSPHKIISVWHPNVIFLKKMMICT